MEASLISRIADLEEACESRQAALETVIGNVLETCRGIVEAKELVDVSAAVGAFAQAIELSLESPQLRPFRHLSVAV